MANFFTKVGVGTVAIVAILVLSLFTDSDSVEATSKVIFEDTSAGELSPEHRSFILKPRTLANRSESIDSGKVTLKLMAYAQGDLRGEEIASEPLGIIRASRSAPEQEVKMAVSYKSLYSSNKRLELLVLEEGKDSSPSKMISEAYEFKAEDWTRWWQRPHVLRVASTIAILLLGCCGSWAILSSKRGRSPMPGLLFFLVLVPMGSLAGRVAFIAFYSLWQQGQAPGPFWIWGGIFGGLWCTACVLILVGRDGRGGRFAQGWSPAGWMGTAVMVLLLAGTAYSTSRLPSLLNEKALAFREEDDRTLQLGEEFNPPNQPGEKLAPLTTTPGIADEDPGASPQGVDLPSPSSGKPSPEEKSQPPALATDPGSNSAGKPVLKEGSMENPLRALPVDEEVLKALPVEVDSDGNPVDEE